MFLEVSCTFGTSYSSDSKGIIFSSLGMIEPHHKLSTVSRLLARWTVLAHKYTNKLPRGKWQRLKGR